MPLSEIQAEWVADLISGAGVLPSYDEMRVQIRKYDDSLRKRYIASKRHTIQVDFHSYMAEVERERRTSSRRASGDGSGGLKALVSRGRRTSEQSSH